MGDFLFSGIGGGRGVRLEVPRLPLHGTVVIHPGRGIGTVAFFVVYG